MRQPPSSRLGKHVQRGERQHDGEPARVADVVAVMAMRVVVTRTVVMMMGHRALLSAPAPPEARARCASLTRELGAGRGAAASGELPFVLGEQRVFAFVRGTTARR